MNPFFALLLKYARDRAVELSFWAALVAGLSAHFGWHYDPLQLQSLATVCADAALAVLMFLPDRKLKK